MRRIALLLIFCLCHFVILCQHQVCFTFDDLPVVGYHHNSISHQREITNKLVAALVKHSVPAIGFVNETKLYVDGRPDRARINLLKQWLENGLELGNHTFAHTNFHRVSFKEYTDDILKGETITKPLAEQYKKPYRYFRHPYLRIGKTQARHDSLNNFLHDHGYAEAPVTIDNTDYLFASAYDKAWSANDDDMMKKIRESFIQYMEEKLLFYQQQSHKLFGRNISHILLLHANALNADCLDELVALYKKHNYDFVSLQTALKDEAYKTAITSYGDWGISWLDRWALSAGKRGDFFAGDPETPEFIIELNRD